MIILGIETSCDETAVSVIKTNGEISVLANAVSSQINLHSKWGGVVPNLAAREHLKNIIPTLESGMEKAGIKIPDIDLICVTNGPGLIPALLIGTNFAKTISYLWKKPLIGVHHIEGHIYANFINSQLSDLNSQIFPLLCLVVSGGHTQLILMRDHLKYEIVGETQDDAAGEAFDKVARILGLGYPGGPAIAAAAEKYRRDAEKRGKNPRESASVPRKSALPRPMINSKDLNFSFSGLKTAVLYAVKKNPKILEDENLISSLSAEFQQSVIDVLIAKTLKAAEIYKPKTIMLA
ncbi:MAG TPA: tRNA (adenosine(37)-N6)-threonylcarbamoyltransferase complex transferase subunit TsaD, partial [Candidatus Moranbacteria bacterium]|nr:tRNA (adenosine(37)-N6)-threonylcarbamoyltransferase complex transferase subunit TsaD [Candidatus Moranbacteria bacterium]